MTRITKKVKSAKEIEDNMSYIYQKKNTFFFKDCSGIWIVLGKTSVTFPTLEKVIEFIF